MATKALSLAHLPLDQSSDFRSDEVFEKYSLPPEQHQFNNYQSVTTANTHRLHHAFHFSSHYSANMGLPVVPWACLLHSIHIDSPDSQETSEDNWLKYYHMNDVHSLCLQCFDAVGWAAGRASGL